jgi:hypothetical protein
MTCAAIRQRSCRERKKAARMVETAELISQVEKFGVYFELEDAGWRGCRWIRVAIIYPTHAAELAVAEVIERLRRHRQIAKRYLLARDGAPAPAGSALPHTYSDNSGAIEFLGELQLLERQIERILTEESLSAAEELLPEDLVID